VPSPLNVPVLGSYTRLFSRWYVSWVSPSSETCHMLSDTKLDVVVSTTKEKAAQRSPPQSAWYSAAKVLVWLLYVGS